MKSVKSVSDMLQQVNHWNKQLQRVRMRVYVYLQLSYEAT